MCIDLVSSNFVLDKHDQGLTFVVDQEGNGALHVHTKQGEGTTFTIYLPGAELTK